ncbi:MAG: hypothetical protein MZV63_60475 [Marinilabiliales bacterium]|nr:hypothetical protein [Marinilabiliales bacterium]
MPGIQQCIAIRKPWRTSRAESTQGGGCHRGRRGRGLRAAIDLARMGNQVGRWSRKRTHAGGHLSRHRACHSQRTRMDRNRWTSLVENLLARIKPPGNITLFTPMPRWRK